MDNKFKRLAFACYLAVSAFHKKHGNTQPAWETLAPEEQARYEADVEFLMDNPTAQPSTLHNKWVDAKTQEGWRSGTKKDDDEKTHPCMVNFSHLTDLQQQPVIIFHTTVRTAQAKNFENLPELTPAAPATTEQPVETKTETATYMDAGKNTGKEGSAPVENTAENNTPVEETKPTEPETTNPVEEPVENSGSEESTRATEENSDRRN